MALFRRLRKDKEESPTEGGKPAPNAPSSPSPAPPKPEGNPAPGSQGPAPPASAPPPATLPTVSAPPPRLPEKPPAEAVRPRVERGPFGVCFVCGSVLEGRVCPTCRIAWVE